MCQTKCASFNAELGHTNKSPFHIHDLCRLTHVMCQGRISWIYHIACDSPGRTQAAIYAAKLPC